MYDVSRALVCEECGIAVSGTKKAIKKHLEQYHPCEGNIATTAELLGYHNPMKCSDAEAIRDLQHKGYHAGLSVKPGFACPAAQCVFASESLEWIKKHMNQHTPAIHTPLQDRPCQTIFKKPGPKSHSTFQVQLEDLPPAVLTKFEQEVQDKSKQMSCTTPEPFSDAGGYDLKWTSSFEAFEDQQRREQALETHRHLEDLGQQTLWTRRTQFSMLLDGYNPTELHRLTSLPEKKCFSDDLLWEHSLVPVLKTLFEEWHHHARAQSPRVLRQFRTTDSNPLASYSMTPMRIVSNYGPYSMTFVHFVVFLLRASGPSSVYKGLALSVNIAQAVERVRSHIPQGQASNGEYPFSRDRLSRSCEQLFVAVAKHQFVRHEKENPLIHFLAVHSYNPSTRNLLPAHKVSPYLSHLIYLLRIVGISDATKCTADEDISTVIDEYCVRNLRENSRSPFGAILSLLLYAKRVGMNCYSLPNTTWTKDGSSLDYCGARLSMDEFVAFVSRRCQALREFVCESLLFRPESFLNRRSAGDIRDDPLWEVAGHNFSNITELNPHLSDAWKNTFFSDDVSSRSTALQTLHAMIEGGSQGRPPTVDELFRLQAYSGNLDAAIEQIAVLIYLLGGSPPRGTDLTAVQFVNSPTSKRNIYIFDGELAVVHLVNKTEALLDQPKMIARFMPAEVSEVIVSLLVDAIPFERYLYWAAKKPSKRHATCLFGEFRRGPSQRSEWVSHQLMSAVEADSHFNFPSDKFNLRNLRHIMIAIDRKLRPDPYQSLGLENDCTAHVFLAGHSEEVENHHYALDTTHLAQLSEQTLNMFRRASERWWRFYGLHSAPAEPPTRNLSTCVSLVERCLSALEAQGRKLHQMSDTILRLTNDTALHKTNTRKRAHGDVMEEPHPKRRQLDSEQEALQLVRKAVGDAEAAWRSEGQRAAVVQAVIEEVQHLIVSIPPGHGKSAIVHTLALRHPGSIMLVVTPYLVLRKQYQYDLASLGIQSNVWSLSSRTGVVFLTPEQVNDHLDLLGWICTVKHQLRAIVFDECHVVALQQNFREKLLPVAGALACAVLSNELKCQLILMSGTLPIPILASTLFEFSTNHAQVGSPLKVTHRAFDWQMIEEPLQRSNIKLIVQLMKIDESDWFINEAIHRTWSSTRSMTRLLIITNTINRAKAIAARHNLHAFTGDTPPDIREAIIHRLREERVAVGTTALTTGVNLPPPLTHVIYLGPCYGLSQCLQTATRGGRDGSSSWFVNILDSRTSDGCEEIAGGGFAEYSPALDEQDREPRLVSALRLIKEDPDHLRSLADTREMEAYQRFSKLPSIRCRWAIITDYFNDSQSSQACGSFCDVCCPSFSSMPLQDVLFPSVAPEAVYNTLPMVASFDSALLESLPILLPESPPASEWSFLAEEDEIWRQELNHLPPPDTEEGYNAIANANVAGDMEMVSHTRPILYNDECYQDLSLSDIFTMSSSLAEQLQLEFTPPTDIPSVNISKASGHQQDTHGHQGAPNALGEHIQCTQNHANFMTTCPTISSESEPELVASSWVTHVSNTTSRSLSSLSSDPCNSAYSDVPSLPMKLWGGQFITFDPHIPATDVDARVARFLNDQTRDHVTCFDRVRHALFVEIYERGHCLPCFLAGRLHFAAGRDHVMQCPHLSPAKKGMLGQKKELKKTNLPPGVCFRCGFSSRDKRYHPGERGRHPDNCHLGKPSSPYEACQMLWNVLLLAAADPCYHLALTAVGNQSTHFATIEDFSDFETLRRSYQSGPEVGLRVRRPLQWWGEKAFLYVSMVAWYRWEVSKLRPSFG